MLSFSRVCKYFGGQSVLSEVSFVLGRAQRLAVVGANGCGKSTLLKLAAGVLVADQGAIDLDARVDVGYLEQLAPLCTKSGGEVQRDRLSGLMRNRHGLLLLDEPTNNLDREARLWLEKELLRSSSAALIVSHDRAFLDAVVERVIELDGGAATIFGGNYSRYVAERESRAARQWMMYERQQKLITGLKQDIARTKDQARATEKETQHDYWRGRAKKVAAKAKARETRLNRELDGQHKIEKPRPSQKIRLDFQALSLGQRILFDARDAAVCIDGREILSNLRFTLAAGQRVRIEGNNGSGKSTLLRLLLKELELSNGQLLTCENLSIAYLPQIGLHASCTDSVLDWFINQDGSQTLASARTFLKRFLFSGDDVWKRIGELSCGERMRLWLAACALAKAELVILDEPTNHLDALAIESLEMALRTFAGALVVVTHDRAFAEALSTDETWSIKGGRLTIAST